MSFSYLISGTFPDYGRSVSRHGKFVTKVNVRIASRDEVKKIMSFDGDFAANYILMRGAIYGQIPEYRTHEDPYTLQVVIQNGSKNDSPLELVDNEDFRNLCSLISTTAKHHNWGSVSRNNIEVYFSQLSEDEEPEYDENGDLIDNNLPDDVPGAIDTIALESSKVYENRSDVSHVDLHPKIENKTVWQLSDEVLSGVYETNTPDGLSELLGDKYDDVVRQARLKLGNFDDLEEEGSEPTIEHYADALMYNSFGETEEEQKQAIGDKYSEVKRLVDSRSKAVLSGKSVSDLANEVLRGAHGDGKLRRASLGAQFDTVQREVDRITSAF